MGDAYERGRVLYRQGRYKQAADEFRRELSVDVGSANAHAMLGMSLLNAGDPVGAEAAMLEAVRLGPDVGYAHYALACLTVRGPTMAGGGVLKRIARRQPAAARRRLDTARGRVLTAIQLEPRNADYFSLLAGIDYDLRAWDSAIWATRQGLAINPLHARCQTLLGRALGMAGRSSEAEQAFRQVLQHDPENAGAHMAQGWHQLRAGRSKRAAEHFRESLRLDPTQPRGKVAMRHARWLWFPPYAILARSAARATRRGRPSQVARVSMAAVSIGVSSMMTAGGAGSAGTSIVLFFGVVLLVAATIRWLVNRRP
jgi:tetratricopeptide (TPR) repeat protein